MKETMEDYLNPPEAATREQGGSMSDMGPKLRATMERLHMEAELRAAKAYAEPICAGILGIIGGKK